VLAPGVQGLKSQMGLKLEMLELVLLLLVLLLLV
jgi:hypothetical protein